MATKTMSMKEKKARARALLRERARPEQTVPMPKERIDLIPPGHVVVAPVSVQLDGFSDWYNKQWWRTADQFNDAMEDEDYDWEDSNYVDKTKENLPSLQMIIDNMPAWIRYIYVLELEDYRTDYETHQLWATAELIPVDEDKEYNSWSPLLRKNGRSTRAVPNLDLGKYDTPGLATDTKGVRMLIGHIYALKAPDTHLAKGKKLQKVYDTKLDGIRKGRHTNLLIWRGGRCEWWKESTMQELVYPKT